MNAMIVAIAAIAAAGLLVAGLACGGDEPARQAPTETPDRVERRATPDRVERRATRFAEATRRAVTRAVATTPTPTARPTHDPAAWSRFMHPTREAYFATRDAWQTRNPVALPTRVPTRDARSSYRTRVADPSDVTGKGLGDPESVEDCIFVEHSIDTAFEFGLTWDEILYDMGVTADFLLRFREACLRSRSR